MLVVGTSRWSANCEVAVCSSRSASVRVRPTSRAIAASERVVSSVMSSTLRWVIDSLPRASRVAFTSASRPFSRCHSFAVCRRWARLEARTRTHASASSTPGDLAPVVPGDDERVADRSAGGREVAGEAVRQQQQAGADVLVELVELVGLPHGAIHGSPRPRSVPKRRVRPDPAPRAGMMVRP